MAVQIPTLNELITSIRGDLEGKLGVLIPIFGKSYLNVLASVQAAKIKLIYLAIASVQKNVFPDLAESEAVGGTLERFGRIKLNRNPFPSVAAIYTVKFSGEIGAVIKANTTFKSDDSSTSPSKLFILDADVVFTGTTQGIVLRALEGGLGSKLQAADTLTSTSPILNVGSVGLVQNVITEPLDAETLEVYRAKVVEAFRLEPEGGSGSDYRLWASDVQGVRTVYPYAKTGSANEIQIYVESSDVSFLPDAQMLLDVAEVIEFDPDTSSPLEERGRRPLGVFNVEVLAVPLVLIDITIHGFVGLTANIVVDIEEALKSGLYKLRPFIAATDILAEKNDVVSNSKLNFMLLNQNSYTFNNITFQIEGTAFDTFTLTYGDVPVLNSISYV